MWKRYLSPMVQDFRPLIAVVDDEESVRRAIGRLIVSAGLDVVAYPGGREFLDALKSRRPDCVILDLHMSGISGFEIQLELARENHEIPVIVITGRDSPESKSRVLEAGASAYLLKPVTASVLLDSIHKAIGQLKQDGQTVLANDPR